MNGNEPGRVTGMSVLRAAAAGYLIYLGITLISDHLSGKSTMAPWLAWCFGVLFVFAGAVFLWYSWKRYRQEMAEQPGASEDPADEAAEESSDTEE